MNRTLLVGMLCVSAGLTLSSCRKTPEQRYAAFVAKGKSLFEKKQYAAANLEYLNASQLRPNDAEALHLLATVALVDGDYGRAVDYLRKALTKNPQYVPARLKLAEIMASSPVKTHVAEAESAAESAVQDAPSDAEAVRILAKARLKLGDYEGAEERFNKSVSLMPQHLMSSIGLAVLKWKKNDLAGAEEVLKKAVASAPKASEPLLVLGRFYRLTKRNQEAEGALRSAAQLDRKSGLALGDLAQLYVEQGRDSEVEATYRAMAQLPDRRFKPLHAVYLFGRGRQAEAIPELKALADADRGDREARSLLVAAYVLTNQRPLAAKVLADALSKNGKDASALLERGRMYLADGKYDEVERDMRSVIQLTHNSAEAHYLLARALRKSTSKGVARQELAEALRLDPRLLAARTDMSWSYREVNQLDAAQRTLDAAPADQRQSLELTIEQNWIWLAKGEAAQLQKSFEALRKPVQDATLLVQEAVFRNQQKDYAGAIQRAEEALRVNPRDLRALEAMTNAYVAQRQVLTAIGRVKDYADAQPRSAQLRYYLATWQLKADRKDEARSTLEKAIAIDGTFEAARLTMAQLEAAAGRYDAARQQVEAILQKAPRDKSAWMLSGAIEEGARNYEGAIQAYSKAVDLDDANAGALNNLAYLMVEHTADLDQALKYAQRAKQISPDSADVNDTLGWIYFHRGAYKTAIQHLEMSDKGRTAAITKYHLAMAYHRAGERDRAMQALMAGSKLDPSLVEAKMATQLLSR